MMLPRVWSSLFRVNIAALGTWARVTHYSHVSRVTRPNLGVLLPRDLLLPVEQKEGLECWRSVHDRDPGSGEASRNRRRAAPAEGGGAAEVGKAGVLGHCDTPHNTTHVPCGVYLVMVQHTPGPLPAEGYLQYLRYCI